MLSVASPQIDLFNTSPALFVQNQGQVADQSVRYAFNGSGANILFTDAGLSFQVYQSSASDSATADNATVSKSLGVGSIQNDDPGGAAFQTDYTSIFGDHFRMNVWEGDHISFLTPISRTDLDPAQMARIVATVDKAYEYYKLATGKDPIPYAPNFYQNGRGTIAVVDKTGGAGYSYLGWTGIELQTDYFNILYNGVVNNDQYDQLVFYELGRNFWHYDSTLDGASIGSESFATGFAVFMRFKSLEYAGEAGGPFNSWTFPQFQQNVEGLVDQYTANSSLNFNNTLATGQGVPGSGLNSTDLFASFLFRLGRDYGGDDFFLNIWKQVDARPEVSTDQGAIDNFFLASCRASHRDLTDLFVNQWRWPISSSALAEAAALPQPTNYAVLRFEVLARSVAWWDGWKKDDEVVCDGADLNYLVDCVFQNKTGFYALGLTSALYGSCLVIRGTESTSDGFVDVWSDVDPHGVGYNQFISARSDVFEWLDDHSGSDITGHSLGGTLAQWIAAAYTATGGLIDQLVTFNATGISTEMATSFVSQNANSVTHYIVNGDIVSMAGEAFVAGTVYMATFSDLNLLNNHALPLMVPKVYIYDSSPIQYRYQHSNITWHTISVDALNDYHFSYTDEDYNLWLLGLQITLNVSSDAGFSSVPAALKYRGETELARERIGDALEAIKYGTETAFAWSLNVEGNYSFTFNTANVASRLYKSMVITVAPDFTLTFVNGDSPSLLFDGSLSIDLDYTVNIALPSWLGGSITAAHLLIPIDINANGVINKDHLVANEELSILGGLVMFNGTAELDWKDGVCVLQGDLNIGDGFINSPGMTIRIDSDLNIVSQGPATVAIPSSVKWIRNTVLTGANYLLKFTNDGNMSNDFVAGWRSLGGHELGLRVWFDNRWQLLGAKEINSMTLRAASTAKTTMMATAADAGTTSYSESYSIAPGTDWAMSFVEWENASTTATLTLTTPSGQMLTEADTSVSVISELSNDRRKAVRINSPEAGTWTVTLTDTTELGTTDISAYVEDAIPSVGVANVSGGLQRQPVSIDLAAYDADSVATIALFYDTDAQGYDGVMIADGILETDGTSQYSWNTTRVAAGDYYVYAMIMDDSNPPVYDYSDSTVTITEDTTAPTLTLMAPTLTNNSTPSGTVAVTDSGSGVPDGTTVFLDVDLDGNGTYEANEMGVATASLIDGMATFTTNSYTSQIADGTYILRARVSDAAGNEGISDVATVTIDATQPTVTLTAPDFSWSSTLTATVTAVDTCSGVPDGTPVFLDVDLNGDGYFTAPGETDFATATLSGGAATFNCLLPVGIYRFQARVSDVAGNEGISDVAEISLWASMSQVELRVPAFANSSTLAVTVTATGGDPGVSDGAPVFLDVDLNNDGDFTDSGEAGNATATLIGGTATAVLSLPTSEDGTYQVHARARVSDVAGNETTSDRFPQTGIYTVTVDTIAPTVTIAPASFMTSPTSKTTIYFAVTFSEPISDFSAASLTLGGTAGATTATLVAGGGGNCIVAVSGMTQTGDVTATIDLGKIHDRAGNGNTESTSATVVYDTTLPNTSVGVSGVVWNDQNGNGIQNTGEPGVGGAVVQIYLATHETAGNADDILLGTAVTDAQGRYSFSNLPGGVSYYEVFRTPVGYTFTTQNADNDTTVDSDPDATGVTALFAVPAGQTDATRDAGLVGAAPGFGFAFSVPNANTSFTAADALGNVYVVGSFSGTVDFDPGPGTFNFASDSDGMFAAKYSSAGALIWVKSVDSRGSGNSVYAGGSALGSDGSIYTTGMFSGTVDFDPGEDTSNLVSSGGDAFVWKLDSNGNFVWAKGTANGSLGWAPANGIAVGSDGSVCIVGSFGGTVDFDPSPNTFNLTSTGDQSVFVLKLDSAGNFDWAKSTAGGWAYAYDIAIDSTGSVYIVGKFSDTIDFDPGEDTSNLVSSGGKAFVWKLDSNGIFVWAKSTTGNFTNGSPGWAEPNGIAVDSDGNVYTTGYFSNTVDFNPDPNVAFSLTSTADGSVFILKLDSEGSFVWAKGVNSPNYRYGMAVCIGLDSSGNVYVAGTFWGTVDFDPGEGISNLTSADKDAFLLKLDTDGNFVWAKSTTSVNNAENGTDSTCYASGIAVGSDGYVYASGCFSGTVDFDPGPGTFNLTSVVSGSSGFILKLDNMPPVVTVDRLATNSHSPALSGTVDDPLAVIQVTVGENTYGAANNGNGTWTLPENTISPSLLPGLYEVVVTATDLAGNVGTDSTTNELRVLATVLSRHIFYNRSYFDGNNPATNAQDDAAIASDKSALLPGQIATFQNYTSYSRGINGIMVDIAGIWNVSDVNADDFLFRLGNNSDPDTWPLVAAVPTITVRPGEGADGSDRVTIVWPNGTIANQWLQITVLATDHTSLAEPDVFYFGNAVGESGNAPGNAIVNATDEIMARNFYHGVLNPAAINDPYDYNRDGLVNGTDQIIARNNQTNPLSMLRLIAAPPVETKAAATDSDLLEPSLAELNWLYELQQMNHRTTKRTSPAEAAVDKLLATYW